MKVFIPVCIVVFFVACTSDFGSEELAATAPAVPEAWLSALGQPVWLFKWYGPDGRERSAESSTGSMPLALPDAAASPILAYPHWPDLGIQAGTGRPAGAIVPFGVAGGAVALTWKGGVAGVFYRELLHASGGESRLPEYFDWPRFAALLESDQLDGAVRADPWIVDWRSVAIRTRVTGFDRRRLKSRPVTALRVVLPCGGPWVASSPFSAALTVSGDGSAEVSASEDADTLLSPSGELRFNARAWVWFPNKLDKSFRIR